MPKLRSGAAKEILAPPLHPPPPQLDPMVHLFKPLPPKAFPNHCNKTWHVPSGFQGLAGRHLSGSSSLCLPSWNHSSFFFSPISQGCLSTVAPVLQEGGPFPGPKSALLSNTQKWTVRGNTCADKARDVIGKGQPGVLWWCGLFLGLSGPGVFLVGAYRSVKMESSEKDSGRLVGCMELCVLSPLTLPEFFRLVVAC